MSNIRMPARKYRKGRQKIGEYTHTLFSSLMPILFSTIILLAGCGNDSSVGSTVAEGDTLRVDSTEESFTVVQLTGGLEHPWGMDWLPDGRLLITERPGRLNLMEGADVTEISGLPDVQVQNQGGLLDVKVHPDYEETGWIYFTWSASVDGGTGTALSRARLSESEDELVDLEQIYLQEPGYNSDRHYGSRIVMPGDGTIYFTIGDRAQGSPAQDLGDPAGSVIRLNEDGSIPDDNPFVDREGALPEIWSYGHRNPQGMTIHPETGEIWEHEHGPQGGDALNIIRKGANYGWPDATYGREYGSGAEIGIDPDEDPDVEDPITWWGPTSIAPSGMTFYFGNQFPGWEGDLFIGALLEEHLLRLEMNGEEVVHQEELLRDELGRIRDVRTGPDGYIYLLTDHSDGGLYRLEPESGE